MIRISLTISSLIAGTSALAMTPVARADDSVTYEVASSAITAANIEYSDVSGRTTLQNVALPWRTNVMVANPHSADASLRADWQPASARYKWLTVRVYTHGELLCENTVDMGDAECYGTGIHYVQLPPQNWCPPPVLSCGGAYRP